MPIREVLRPSDVQDEFFEDDVNDITSQIDEKLKTIPGNVIVFRQSLTNQRTGGTMWSNSVWNKVIEIYSGNGWNLRYDGVQIQFIK